MCFNGTTWDRVRGDLTNGLVVNLGANNDVTVAALPLPSGAATSALQTQPGVDIGDVTVNNASGAAAVNIQDGGNTITVDGTVAVTGTFWQVTQPVSGTLGATQSGTWTVQPGNTPNTTAWLVKETRSATATETQVADNAASVTILAANAARLGVSITNDSTVTLYLRMSSSAATTTVYSVPLVAGAYYEVPYGYTGEITGIWASDPNTGAARVTEFT